MNKPQIYLANNEWESSNDSSVLPQREYPLWVPADEEAEALFKRFNLKPFRWDYHDKEEMPFVYRKAEGGESYNGRIKRAESGD